MASLKYNSVSRGAMDDHPLGELKHPLLKVLMIIQLANGRIEADTTLFLKNSLPSMGVRFHHLIGRYRDSRSHPRHINSRFTKMKAQLREQV